MLYINKVNLYSEAKMVYQMVVTGVGAGPGWARLPSKHEQGLGHLRPLGRHLQLTLGGHSFQHSTFTLAIAPL